FFPLDSEDCFPAIGVCHVVRRHPANRIARVPDRAMKGGGPVGPKRRTDTQVKMRDIRESAVRVFYEAELLIASVARTLRKLCRKQGVEEAKPIKRYEPKRDGNVFFASVARATRCAVGNATERTQQG